MAGSHLRPIGCDHPHEGTSDLPFTNRMEFENGAFPRRQRYRWRCSEYRTVASGTTVTSHVQRLGAHRWIGGVQIRYEPIDNDTDGDMLPDFWEYHIGWNESMITGVP